MPDKDEEVDEKRRVLYLMGYSDNTRAVIDYLTAQGSKVTAVDAYRLSPAGAVEMANSILPDVVVADISFIYGNHENRYAIELARLLTGNLPVVILSSTDDDYEEVKDCAIFCQRDDLSGIALAVS